MKKPRLALILALVFLLTGVATGLNAQGQEGYVRGYVRGRDGNPKASTSVKLTGPGNYIALTNFQGEFSFDKVMPGTYKVTVLQGNNYQEFTRNVPGGNFNLVVNW